MQVSNKLSVKFRRTIGFLALMNVEPVLFAMMFFFSLKRTPTDQLIQDKICLLKYGAPPNYCLALPRMKPDDDYLHIKSAVLEDTTRFSMYHTLTTTIPSLIAGLLIGSWTDRYQNAKKVLMIAGAISAVLEAAIMVANAYFFDQCWFLF